MYSYSLLEKVIANCIGLSKVSTVKKSVVYIIILL